MNIRTSLVCISLFLFAASQHLHAQNDQLIDSLDKRMRATASASDKIQLLFQLSDLNVYNHPQVSLDYSRQALEQSLKLMDRSLISKSYYQIGSAFWSIGELAAALEQLQYSLEYVDPVLDPELISRIYLRIGAIYTASDDNIKGIYYYNKARPYFDQLENDFIKFALYNNIGKALMDINYLDSASSYFDAAVRLEKQIPERSLPILLFNLADLSYRQGNLDVSNKYMQRCDSLATLYNDLRSQIRVSQLSAEISLENESLQESLRLIEQAATQAEETGVRELIAITNRTYSRVLEKMGDKNQAYEALKISQSYFDSIKTTQAKNQLELYNFDESEKEKEELRRLQEISELKASTQQQFTAVAIVVAFLMVAIAITNYRSRQLIKKQNHDLQGKNQLIEKQKQQLDDLNVFKTKVMGIMAHDVKSPIQSIFGIIDLLDNKLMTTEELQEFLPHVSDQLTHVSLLLNNIFEWSRAGLNEESVRPDHISLATLINGCIKENKMTAEAKSLKIENKVSDELEAFADPHMIRVVVRNLLHNAIKYSNPNDKIIFEGRRNDQSVSFSITDAGIGMSEETIHKLFSYDKESEIGTAQEIGSGFGLIVCKDFLEMNHGNISVNSEQNRGTTFTITLPLQ